MRGIYYCRLAQIAVVHWRMSAGISKFSNFEAVLSRNVEIQYFLLRKFCLCAVGRKMCCEPTLQFIPPCQGKNGHNTSCQYLVKSTQLLQRFSSLHEYSMKGIFLTKTVSQTISSSFCFRILQLKLCEAWGGCVDLLMLIIS